MLYAPLLRIYSSLTFQQLALKEHDDKQLYIARQNLSDLRNVYAVVTDIIHKNITKVLSTFPDDICSSMSLVASHAKR
jgi:hypothetical protein